MAWQPVAECSRYPWVARVVGVLAGIAAGATVYWIATAIPGVRGRIERIHSNQEELEAVPLL